MYNKQWHSLHKPLVILLSLLLWSFFRFLGLYNFNDATTDVERLSIHQVVLVPLLWQIVTVMTVTMICHFELMPEVRGRFN